MKRIYFLFLLLITLAFTNCKKWQHQYPEDTERTKNSPIERLANKWWTLQSVYINNQDYTDSLYQIFGKYQIYFSQNLYETTLKGLDNYYGSIKTELEVPFTSIWTLSKDESNIGIGPFNGNSSSKVSIVPGYLNESSFNLWLFKIQKLNNSEFKISISTKNNDTTITNYFISQ